MSTWRQFGSSQRDGIENPAAREEREREEELRRQAEEQRQQAEAAQQAQEEEQRRQERTYNPLEGLSEWLSADAVGPILGVVDQGLDAIGVQSDLQGDYAERAETANDNFMWSGRSREEVQQRFEEEANKWPHIVGSEAIRAVAGAPARVAEGVLDTGALIVDTLRTDRNPFADDYQRAKFDLGVNSPHTPVGRAAEGILSMVIAMRQINPRLPKALIGLGTGGKGLRGAIASGAVPGLIADFLLASPDSGNMSSLIRDLLPEDSGLRDSFLFALAVDEDDNPWAAKVKSMIEGGFIVGPLFDLILFGARGAARRVLRRGGTKEEALQAGLEEARRAGDAAASRNNVEVTAERRRWTQANETEMNTLLERERRLMVEEEGLAARGLADDDPFLSNLRLELEETRMSVRDLDNRIMQGYDPSDSSRAPHDRAATTSTANINRSVTQQVQLENAPIPPQVRSGNVPSNARVNQVTLGGSRHIITDAGYRLLNLGDSAEQLVRDTTRRTDLQGMAKSLGMTDDELVNHAARIVQNVRDADRAWNEPVADIADLLREQGALMQISGATDGTPSEVLTREGVVALKGLITDTANQIADLALNADQMGAIRAAGGNQVERLTDRLVSMLAFHKQAAVFHGGGLRAFNVTLDGDRGFLGRMFGGDSAELTMRQAREWAAKVNQLSRAGSPEAQEELDKLVRAMVLAGGDPTKQVNFMSQAIKMGTDSLMTGMYSSQLSGAATHGRNALGNTYSLLERPASVLLNGVLTGDRDKVTSALAGYHGIITGVQDAWQIARVTFRTGDPASSNLKFTIREAQTKAQIQQLKKAAIPGSSEERAAGFVEMLHNFHNGPFIQAPLRLLSSADDFFKHLNARQHFATSSMHKALKDGASPNDFNRLFDNYMSEFSKAVDPQTGRILDANLLDYAQRATFQQDPGTMINTLTSFLNQVPFGRIFVPYVRTPANLLAYAGEHTPGLARMFKSFKDAKLSGDAVRIAEAEGREAIGGMILSIAGIAAASGNVTGGGPVDLRERRVWEQTHRPYSVKIGNQWVSYQGIEPFQTIVAPIADLTGLAAMGSLDSSERIAAQIAYSIGSAIVDKSYLQGLSDVARALDPREMTPEGFTRGLLGTANNFIPYAAARRALSNSIDPYMKEVRGEIDRALNNALPGYKLSGTTKVDFLTGEEVESSSGGIWNANSPIKITPVNQDPIKDMLVDIRFEMGDLLKSGPSGIELNAEERRQLALEMHEGGVRTELERLMKQSWFKKSVKEWKDQGFRFVPDDENDRPRHYVAVSRIINGSRRRALDRISRDKNFDLGERLQQRRQEARRTRRGDYRAVEELQNMPN